MNQDQLAKVVAYSASRRKGTALAVDVLLLIRDELASHPAVAVGFLSHLTKELSPPAPAQMTQSQAGEFCLPFGIHKGKKLRDAHSEDPQYTSWLHDATRELLSHLAAFLGVPL